MVFFCVSLLLLLKKTKKLDWFEVFLILTVAFFLFLPNIFWNYLHDFPTLKHHVEMTSLDRGAKVHLFPLVEFFLGQFLLFSPLIFLVFLFSLAKNRKLVFDVSRKLEFKNNSLSINEIWVFSIYFILPILGVVTLLSLVGETEINWASPIAIPIVIYVSILLSRLERIPKRREMVRFLISTTLIFNLVFLIFFITSPKVLDKLELTNSPQHNPFLQVKGFAELSDLIESLSYAKGNIIASNNRGLLATLSLYLPEYHIRSINKNGIYNHWDLEYPLSETETKKTFLVVLLIKNDKNSLEKIISDFKRTFSSVKLVKNDKIDSLIIQGKKNQRLLLIWVNK